MAAIGEAVVTIRADTGSFEGDINKSIGGIAKAVAGMAIAKGAFDFVKEGVTRLGEMEVSAARTAAVIKSTGGAANVTAESIGKFGDKIQGTIGVQADLVASGQNVLLKYTDVRNEIGKGNDIFNQARTAMVDLSVATGRDMPAAAAILGRALQDPEKATGALRKAGVFLSANQQQLVKDFTASGNTIGAQKVILEAVNKVVEGSAKAYGETLPAKLAVAQQSFLDVKASIASSLLPAIQLGADGIIFLTDQFQKLPGAVQTGVGAIIGLGAVAGTIAAPIESIVNVFTQLKPKVAEAAGEVTSAGASLVAMGSSAGVSAGQLSLFGGSVAASAGISTAALALTATGVGALVVGLGALIVTNKQSGLSSDTFAASLRNVPVTESAAALGTYVQSLEKVRPVTDQAIVGFTGYKASVEGASNSDLAHIRVLEGFSQVASTNLQQATAIRDEWAKHPAVLAAAGVTLGELDAKISENSTKMAEHAGHIVTDQQVTNQWAAAVQAATPIIDNIKQATEGWTATVAAGIGPALESTNAVVNYQASVDKLTEALLQDTTGMNEQEVAGRNVQVALENVTITTLKDVEAQIAAAEATGNHAAAADVAALASQRMAGDILNSGAAAGYSADQMVLYTADVLNIPPDAVTTILENSADAGARIAGFVSYFLNLNGTSSTVTLITNRIENIIRNFQTTGLTFGGGVQGSGWGYAHGGIAGAASGLVTRGPALRWIGEAGPEAVVPLGPTSTNARDRDRVMKQAGLFQVNPMAAGGIIGTVNTTGGWDDARLASLLAAILGELAGIRENQNTSSRKLPGRTPVGVRR